ncbi:hypothetical protein AM1_0470 [Acaryochloris marina MBIC11017]|uniref:Uncharacterized protein n=1 Tax=Acaryochloris marina (strain MBIC 11017) TaxID=329726 RepID=B0CBY4_ACAM1|nr:hypothetical protein AM1_0470 [Acaryochloris marina MBIC11017]
MQVAVVSIQTAIFFGAVAGSHAISKSRSIIIMSQTDIEESLNVLPGR